MNPLAALRALRTAHSRRLLHRKAAILGAPGRRGLDGWENFFRLVHDSPEIPVPGVHESFRNAVFEGAEVTPHPARDG